MNYAPLVLNIIYIYLLYCPNNTVVNFCLNFKKINLH